MSVGETLQVDSQLAEPEPKDAVWAIKVLVPMLMLGVLFASPFYLVWIRWEDTEGYYTHGPLVPFVSAYLVLRARKKLTGEAPPENGPLLAGGIGAAVLYFVFNDFEWDKRWLFAVLFVTAMTYMVYQLRNLKPVPWKPGLLLFIPALLLCVIAGSMEIVSVGWFFSVLTVIGAVVYYLGKRAALVMAFPLLFLFSSVPLPEYKVQELALPLKMGATANTVTVLNRGLGIYCVREGSTIKIPPVDGSEEETKVVQVGAVCSGLRSLIALISFGLLFAYITPLSRTKKAILFIATIPASFVANLFRILALALVTHIWTEKIATGSGLWDAMEGGALKSLLPQLRKMSSEPVHDVTGVMIFVVAFIGLFALERLLAWLERRFGRATSDFWVFLAGGVCLCVAGGLVCALSFPAAWGIPLGILCVVVPLGAAPWLLWGPLRRIHDRMRERDDAAARAAIEEAEAAAEGTHG